MKLYEVPNNTWVITQHGTKIHFFHIDGMYSFCKTEDGEICHLVAWEEVEIVLDKEEN